MIRPIEAFVEHSRRQKLLIRYFEEPFIIVNKEMQINKWVEYLTRHRERNIRVTIIKNQIVGRRGKTKIGTRNIETRGI